MKKELIAAAAWAAVMLTLAIGAKVAHQLGYIDRETVQRVVTAPIGLWMVWYGNRIPKMTFTRNAQARQAQRVSAWAFRVKVILGIRLPYQTIQSPIGAVTRRWTVTWSI